MTETTQFYGVVSMSGPLLIWIGSASFAGMFLMALCRKDVNFRQVLWGGLLCSVAWALYGASVAWSLYHSGFTPQSRLFRLFAGLAVVVAACIVAPKLRGLLDAFCVSKAHEEQAKRADALFEEDQEQIRRNVRYSVTGTSDPPLHYARWR